MDESDFAGDEHLDEEYVAAYDAKAKVDPTEDVEKLVGLGLCKDSLLLDLGAGTGVFALAAAATGASIIAVDVSPAMTGVIADRARAARLENVEVVEGGFLSYGHAGPLADFVYTRNALHQLPDFWKVVALNRIRGLMKRGSNLLLRDLIFDLEPDGVEAGIDTWMSGAVDDPVRFHPPRSRRPRSERFSTYTWMLEPMLARCGLEILENSSRGSTYGMYLCRRIG